MSVERVRSFVHQYDDSLEPVTFPDATETAEAAARVLGVDKAQIAKSILFRVGDRFGLFVTTGDSRIHQKKVKALLGSGKVKMASAEEVMAVTGYSVGGVCPFALQQDVPIFLDESLKRFAVVYTAAGTSNSVLPISFEQLQAVTRGEVVDVCSEKDDVSVNELS